MAKILTIVFLIYTPVTFSQSISTLLGAKAGGMGYASAALSDEWAFFNNIAGLALVKERIIASTFEVRPALPGANRMGALLAIPFSFGTSALGIFRFGDAIYSEQMLSLGFANQIGKTSLGAKLNFIQYRAEGFGTHGAFGINVGGITQITPKLSVGAWIQNINQPKINFANKEKAPIIFLAAFQFKASKNFLLATEIEKDILYRPLWKTGMEYAIHKKFFVRMGFNIHPNALFMGVGFQSKRIKIDYALQSLTQLGASHQATASYRFSGIKPRKE